MSLLCTLPSFVKTLQFNIGVSTPAFHCLCLTVHCFWPYSVYFVSLACIEMCTCNGVFVCLNEIQIFLTYHHISLSLFLAFSQPRGRTGGRVCCFSAARGADVRRTRTHGSVLSDIHFLTLLQTLKEPHTPRHIKDAYVHTDKEFTHTQANINVEVKPHI